MRKIYKIHGMWFFFLLVNMIFAIFGSNFAASYYSSPLLSSLPFFTTLINLVLIWRLYTPIKIKEEEELITENQILRKDLEMLRKLEVKK